ncbi:hypothetical protein GCM10017714_13550 [Curtobacterium pusillum]|uniref:DUF1795 domain-containing protein n=1 Tax=Curtobacterium pusillum TaxID=69373 RepID=A0ABX2M6X2_9MICO|nr:hypothetical protein [Curtobacterium pusillum]NUU13108.1 hypothetical protein [Curtobacterium pusillum]GLK30616.1 hypothetical protein GCM10017610_09010 [Curtobacterium pusillum]
MTGADQGVRTDAADWRVRDTGIGALHVPAQWIDDDRTGALAVVRPESSANPNGAFRENAVLSVVESAGDVVADSSNAIAEARAMVPWSHVVSVTPWPQGPFDRRMQFVYEYDGVTAAVTKFTGTLGGSRIDLTCSAGLDVYPTLVGTFDSIAALSELEVHA